MTGSSIFDNDAIAVLAIFAASLAVFLVLPRKSLSPGDMRVRQMRLLAWLSRNYIWLLILAGATLLAWAFLRYIDKIPGLLGTTLTLLGEVLKETEPTDENTERIRNLAYAFAALAGALTLMATIPFQLIRVWLNERSALTAEQGHITERITKAVEALGAEKTVTRLMQTVSYSLDGELAEDVTGRDDPNPVPDGATAVERGEWQPVSRTVPNMEVRIGAIYALERISQDSLRDHIQIMEILTAYIRQNSPADRAEDFRDPDTGEPIPDWEPLPEDVGDVAPEAHSDMWKARYNHAYILSVARRWARTLAARADIQAAIRVVARRDLDQIAWEKADRRYGGDGYRLDLRKTDLQGVDVSGLDLSRALLAGARLEGVNLRGARLEGVNLFRARLEGANLRGARLEGADLTGARLEGANLGKARLEGADLLMARLEGAAIHFAWLDGRADLRAESNRASALRSVDFTGISVPEDFLKSAFGDGTVTLPPGYKAGEGILAHWRKEKLHPGEFNKAWRAWQVEIGYRQPSSKS